MKLAGGIEPRGKGGIVKGPKDEIERIAKKFNVPVKKLKDLESTRIEWSEEMKKIGIAWLKDYMKWLK